MEQRIHEQTRELLRAWEDLMQVGPRMNTALPEWMTRLEERMSEARPEGGHGKSEHHLFHRVGAVLGRQGRPMTMGELSEAMGVPPNTATRMVDWLVKAGYAGRLADPDDRRVVRVSLTEDGRDLYAAMSEFVLCRAEDLLHRFTPEERVSLVSLLQKLARVLSEELSRD